MFIYSFTKDVTGDKIVVFCLVIVLLLLCLVGKLIFIVCY